MSIAEFGLTIYEGGNIPRSKNILREPSRLNPQRSEGFLCVSLRFLRSRRAVSEKLNKGMSNEEFRSTNDEGSKITRSKIILR